jgi:hypothetical protein
LSSRDSCLRSSPWRPAVVATRSTASLSRTASRPAVRPGDLPSLRRVGHLRPRRRQHGLAVRLGDLPSLRPRICGFVESGCRRARSSPRCPAFLRCLASTADTEDQVSRFGAATCLRCDIRSRCSSLRVLTLAVPECQTSPERVTHHPAVDDRRSCISCRPTTPQSRHRDGSTCTTQKRLSGAINGSHRAA